MSDVLRRFELPERIGRLAELAYNYWWSWHPSARELFRLIDHPLWRQVAHNPVQFLRLVDPAKLAAAAQNTAFCRLYDAVIKTFDDELRTRHTWCARALPELAEHPVAYLSFEFGLHNSLPVYAGGLGILAGDHCKEASDLGIPLVGIGFMYPQGYFRQRISPDGWQESIYAHLEFADAPVRYARTPSGEHCVVKVPLREREVRIAAWQVEVGRVHLYLMDANVEGNDPWDRELTARLYGGDHEHRIEQEMILGIGGVRVLRALGIHPAVWHANEGHAAFMMLERIRELVEQGLTFDQAAKKVRDTTIFTTHTPVPAGNDSFPLHLISKHFRHYWGLLGLTEEEFLGLAAHQEQWGTGFNMTVLALRLAGRANGVSALHGEVSRQMWHALWPDRRVEQVPIDSVTNGVHVPTWIAPEMSLLFNRYLGPDWIKRHDDPDMWELVTEIPDEQLWAVHQQLKRKLLSFLRDRVRHKWQQGLLNAEQVITAGALLDANVLTIGFARRFATYKRAHLIFRDLTRLRELLLSPARPVQLVFAGKAHPADHGGQRLIHLVYSVAKDHRFAGRVAFVEDYDMHLARYLVNGVDVWLNNPRRPQEASGTSGQKAALNGVPHLSILDGWWAEGYTGSNGWAIGDHQQVSSETLQDEIDVESLYRVLEQQVVPLYYERDRDHVPRGWVQVMKQAIRTCAPRFSARRMVKEYAQRFYAPAARAALASKIT